MNRYMLDTNMFTYVVRKRPDVTAMAQIRPTGSLCISTLTEGEIRYGLSKRPDSKLLALAVVELLQLVEILPWTSATALQYGHFRAEMDRQGKRLSPMDLLIAAHAVESKAILVTSDTAFRQIAGLALEDWTAPKL